jgi:hypothetical protein
MADDYSISNLIRCSELPSELTLGLNVGRFPFIVSPSGVIGGASGVPGVLQGQPSSAESAFDIR